MKFRNTEAAQRFAERREREDRAPRLRDEAPDVTHLSLEMSERRAEATAPEIEYIRRIVVQSAPALFEIPCGDTGCAEGGHDITRTVLDELRSRHESFEGEDACYGNVGPNSTPCGRILRFKGTVSYRK